MLPYAQDHSRAPGKDPGRSRARLLSDGHSALSLREGAQDCSITLEDGLLDGYPKVPMLHSKAMFEEELEQSGIPYVIHRAGRRKKAQPVS